MLGRETLSSWSCQYLAARAPGRQDGLVPRAPPDAGGGAASIYTRHMETIDGVPVTDEMIQAWADEAERGYDVEVLRAHGITVSFTTSAPFAPSVSP